MKGRAWFWTLLGSALLIAGGLAHLRSEKPDGLEKVVTARGLNHHEKKRPAPMPDYVVPGLRYKPLSKTLAGVLGTLGTFGLLYGVGRLLLIRRRSAEPGEDDSK